MRLLRIVPDDTKFDFMRFRRISFPMSALLSIMAMVLYFTHGLNFGIDFVGGTLMEVQQKAGPADLAKMRSTLSGLGLGEVQLQQFGTPSDVLIRVAQQPGGDAAQQAAVDKVKGALGSDVEYRRVEVVGPKVGDELVRDGILAVTLSLAGIMGYMAFRFGWRAGLSGVIAILHDCLTTVGLFSVLGLQFDLNVLASVVTIAGFSINDTVVIDDRIRENMRKYKKMSLWDLIDLSINETLSRTVLTAGTVFIAVLALYLFGTSVIHGFAFAMLFGVVIGFQIQGKITF